MASSQKFASDMLQGALNGAIDSLVPVDSDTRGLLESKIYPTLVPAMEALMKEAARCQDAGLKEPEPLEWLASYLLLHNPNAVSVPVPE